MVTKDQALTANDFHYTCNGPCTKTVGPRNGVKVKVVNIRRNGQTQTWKTRPSEFRVPVKYGLYEYGEITHSNCSDFHVVEDCPLNKGSENG